MCVYALLAEDGPFAPIRAPRSRASRLNETRLATGLDGLVY